MEMSVRSGSQYWHTGGSVHKITAVTQPRFKASGLYILGVTPPFTTDAVVIPTKPTERNFLIPFNFSLYQLLTPAKNGPRLKPLDGREMRDYRNVPSS